MVAKEVRCVQEPTETFGARVAQYLDLDGLPFSVSEERPMRAPDAADRKA
jgi:hypothetical protein